MQKYRVMSKAVVLEVVEAATEKEAVDKFIKEDKIRIFSADNVKAVLDSDVAPVLKAFRKENDLTAEEMAGKLGIARMSLYRLESGKVRPRRSTMQRMREIGVL
jgi:DNA-binding XRE family transcriptional regulator